MHQANSVSLYVKNQDKKIKGWYVTTRNKKEGLADEVKKYEILQIRKQKFKNKNQKELNSSNNMTCRIN